MAHLFAGHRAIRAAHSVLDGGEHGARLGQVGHPAPSCRTDPLPTPNSGEPKKTISSNAARAAVMLSRARPCYENRNGVPRRQAIEKFSSPAARRRPMRDVSPESRAAVGSSPGSFLTASFTHFSARNGAICCQPHRSVVIVASPGSCRRVSALLGCAAWIRPCHDGTGLGREEALMARARGTTVGYSIWHFCAVVLFLFRIEGAMTARALANTLPAPPGDRGSQPAPPQATPKTYQNVFAYCRAVRHTSAYADADPPPGYTGPQDPAEVLAAVHANIASWRCMGGHVYACYPGADGSACAHVTTVVAPPAPFWQFCEQNPGSPFVPMFLQSGWASDWKCLGTTPTIDVLFSTDRRGYLAAYWYKVRPTQGARSP